MTNTKSTVPPYAEELTINPEIEQIQEALNKFQQPIPSNFKKLENLKHMCSTQGWKESVCERYSCSVDGEWKQIDICHTPLEKLGLEAKDIPYPVYISSTVLNKGLDLYFAYNVENEEEIFIQKPFTIKSLEKDITQLFELIENLEEKEELSQETIEALKKEKEELEKLKKTWRDKYLEEKGSKNQELQTQITELIRERDNIQQELTNRQTEITNFQAELTQLNNDLQTTQQVSSQLQQNLKRNLISFLLKNKQKVKRINELNNGLSFLRGLLVEKNQEVTNLTNDRDDYQTKWDNSLEDLEQKEEIIRGYLLKIRELEDEKERLNNDWQNRHQQALAQKDNEITRLENEVRKIEEERDARPGDITLDQWNNDYSRRPTQQQLTSLQNQLNNTKNDRDDYQRRWNNHSCPSTYCSRKHFEECNKKHCTGPYGCHCPCSGHIHDRWGGGRSYDAGQREF